MSSSNPKRKRKFNPLLLEAMGASALIQIGLLLLAGSYIVYENVIRDEAMFEEAPPEHIEEPPPENVEVQIQKQQPRVNLTQRALQVKSVGNISVNAVGANIITGEGESFTIAGGELGGVGDLGIGAGTSQLGLGMSEVSVFGLKDSGERILFLIDADKNMLSDERGGLWSYQAIKDEVSKLCGTLAAGTLFNVMMFEQETGRTQAFQRKLVSATPENVEKLTKWLKPFNTSAERTGVKRPNINTRKYTKTPVGRTLKSATWGSGRLRVTQIALEHNIDLVYIITSDWAGFTKLRRNSTKEEKEEWKKVTSDPKYKAQLKLYNEEVKRLQPIIAKKKKAYNASRKAKGQPPKVWGHSYHEPIKFFNLKERVKHPGYEPAQFIKAPVVKKYFSEITKEMYMSKQLAEPKFNVILFIAEDGKIASDKKKQLREFTRFFRNGRYRELKGAKAIKSRQRRNK